MQAKYMDYLIRLPFAAIFIFHGFTKFPIQQGAADMMAFGSPILLGAIAILEIAIGIAVLAGPFVNNMLTKLGGIAAAGVMLGAIVQFHWPRWSFVAAPPDFPMGGMEFQLLVLGVGLYFALRGDS